MDGFKAGRAGMSKSLLIVDNPGQQILYLDQVVVKFDDWPEIQRYNATVSAIVNRSKDIVSEIQNLLEAEKMVDAKAIFKDAIDFGRAPSDNPRVDLITLQHIIDDASD